jgi:anti-anti-sigma factor
MLTVNSKNFGIVSILCLKGRIVRGEIDVLRKAVASQTEVRAVILDLTRVTAIDAGGFSLLLELREYTQSKGIDFKLMNPHQAVSKLFEITRLNTVFEVTSVADVSVQVALERPFPQRERAVCA